jgi:hypothetical protein
MLYGEHKMRFVLAMLLMFPLMACSNRMATVETNASVCGVWRDVSWSSKDTTSTIIEVKQNNARREGWCAGSK